MKNCLSNEQMAKLIEAVANANEQHLNRVVEWLKNVMICENHFGEEFMGEFRLLPQGDIDKYEELTNRYLSKLTPEEIKRGKENGN